MTPSLFVGRSIYPPVHYDRTCDLRNGNPALVSQYAAVVNVPFTLDSPSRYLRPITSMKVQNVRIALQGP
jgi:hypothetical protein